MSRPLQTFLPAPLAPGQTSGTMLDTLWTYHAGEVATVCSELREWAAGITGDAALIARVQLTGDPDSKQRQAGARGGSPGHRNQPATYQRRTLPRAKAAK